MLDAGSKVRIQNINAEDNGIYTCRAENVAGAIDSIGDFMLNKAGNQTYRQINMYMKFNACIQHIYINILL